MEEVFNKIEPKNTNPAKTPVTNIDVDSKSDKNLDYEGEELIKDLTSKKTFTHFQLNDEIS